MKNIFLAYSLFLWPAISFAANAPPSINESKILEHVRSSLSVSPDYEIRLKNVTDSPFPDFYAATLEFQMGQEVRYQSAFISKDGRYYMLGSLFDATVDMDALRRSKAKLEGAPSKGGKNAKVTVVEFSDLQCGSCKKAHESIRNEKIIESYAGRVQLVYKNYPLVRFHPWAFNAAISCLCAYDQKPDAFWKMQDGIYAKQAEITPENLNGTVIGLASSLKLDMKKFERCVQTQATAQRISTDMSEANAIGIASTPTFMVNGRLLTGFTDSSDLKQLIEAFLK